ncbi:LacI family DNA-binding transcriptional regulator [Halalkalibaculum sp. DA3122]|uniref:LacI family DNA-binding transcriptional regulator n=1 Tax=unclassified Halalkalibaculum TaxID=2964617 RepID=UPI0037542EC2
MKKKNSYTVEDVAEEANVSTATVSRVFSGSAKVNTKTTERVIKAAKKLNYRPSRVARRLRVKSTQSMVIGLIVTDLQNPFFSEIARGVEDVAYENKNGVIVCNSDENLKKEHFYLDTLLDEQVAGLIMAPTSGNHEYIQEIVDQNVPVVFVDRHIPSLNVDTVTVDNENGAYKAVKRLIGLGHRRIGIITGIKGIYTTDQRYNGYVKALDEHNIPVDEELVAYGNSKEQGGIEGTRKLLSLDTPPTAIFSTNNLMTLGCFEEMYRQNVNVPDDISIVGFDDMSWASALNPPLTAVRQPGYELGTTAAELLLKRLRDPARTISNIELHSELIIRKSCGTSVARSAADTV